MLLLLLLAVVAAVVAAPEPVAPPAEKRLTRLEKLRLDSQKKTGGQ